MIEIPLQRYEELIQLEAKVDSVVEMIRTDAFISRENILRIIGTEVAFELAEALRRADNERKTKDLEKYGAEANAQM